MCSFSFSLNYIILFRFEAICLNVDYVSMQMDSFITFVLGFFVHLTFGSLNNNRYEIEFYKM